MASDGIPQRSKYAPFTKEGQSLIQRDVETLFLALQQLRTQLGVSTTGNRANASTTPVDLPAETTIGGATVASIVAASVPYPISVANGGTAATTASAARTNLGVRPIATNGGLSSYAGSGPAVGTVPSGCFYALIWAVGAGGTGGRPAPATVWKTLTDSRGDTTDLPLDIAGGGGSGAALYGIIPVIPGDTVTCTSSAAAAGTIVVGDGNDGGTASVALTRGAQTKTYAAGGGGRGKSDGTGGTPGILAISGTLTNSPVELQTFMGVYGGLGGAFPWGLAATRTARSLMYPLNVSCGDGSVGAQVGSNSLASSPGYAVALWLY